MKHMLVFVLSTLVLAGCAGNGASSGSGDASSSGTMGEVIREVSAYGFVTQVSTEERVINIKHAPIPEMNWAPMVMSFNVVEGVDLTPYERGDKVQFVLEVDAEQNYQIKDIKAATH